MFCGFHVSRKDKITLKLPHGRLLIQNSYRKIEITRHHDWCFQHPRLLPFADSSFYGFIFILNKLWWPLSDRMCQHHWRAMINDRKQTYWKCFLSLSLRLILRRLPRSFQQNFHQGFVVIFQLKVGGSWAKFFSCHVVSPKAVRSGNAA